MGISSRLEIPAAQTAVVEGDAGKPTVSNGLPVPEVRPGTVLVKTETVALMPADYKMGVAFPTPGAIIGTDFVGQVVETGSGGSNRFKIGDIVCGAVPGSNPDSPWNGAFAEYVLAPVDLLCHVPSHISRLDAVSTGTPLLTCTVALWGSLGLEGTPLNPVAPAHAKDVLVYGGSSTCGTMAIQLLKLSGHRPITTCSPKNFPLVKSFGAKDVFDFSTPGIGGLIRKHTNGNLRHALDCITDMASARCCYESLGRPGGRYTSLEYCAKDWQTREVVKADFVMTIEAFGIDLNLKEPYYRAANPERHKMCVEFQQIYQTLMEKGQLKAHPVELVGTGFESILRGLDQLRSGFVSGKRLIVNIEPQS